MENIQQLRLSMNNVCTLLDITREGLRKLALSDPAFPRGMKANHDSRQSRVYYDYQEVLNWYENQKKINQI